MGTELAEAERWLNTSQQRHHVQMFDSPPAGQSGTTQITSNCNCETEYTYHVRDNGLDIFYGIRIYHLLVIVIRQGNKSYKIFVKCGHATFLN